MFPPNFLAWIFASFMTLLYPQSVVNPVSPILKVPIKVEPKVLAVLSKTITSDLGSSDLNVELEIAFLIFGEQFHRAIVTKNIEIFFIIIFARVALSKVSEFYGNIRKPSAM